MPEPFAQPYTRQEITSPCSRLPGIEATQRSRQRHVIQGTEFRQEMVELVDKSQGAIAEPAALTLPHAVDVPAIDQDLAVAGSIQAAQHVEQCRLARAGAADDGQGFTGRDGQADIRKNTELLPPLLIRLGQVPTLDDRCFTHSAGPPPAAPGKRATPGRWLQAGSWRGRHRRQ